METEDKITITTAILRQYDILGGILQVEVERLQKRNEWLEEVVALAQEHESIDLSDYGWPVWEESE